MSSSSMNPTRTSTVVWALFLVATLSGFVGYVTLLQMSPPSYGPRQATWNLPADFATLPSFSLTERSGRTVDREDLAGDVVVASFVFTRCHETCPMVTGVMARLQAELPQDVRLLTISVDPRYDVPEVLRVYAENFGADPERWLFLTGERDDVYELIRDGFRVPVEENPDPRRLPGELVSHTTRLVVLDRKVRIRGYFDSGDSAAIAALGERVRELRSLSE